MCLRTTDTPLHAAPLVSASYGAPFTRCSSHVLRRTTPSAPKTAHDLVLVASCLSGHLAQAASRAEVHPTRGASGFSIPSAPKVNHPRFRHRRPAPFGWAVPAQQNLHNSSSISVSIRSPLQSFPRLTEAAREPKPTAQPDVVKASEGHFPQQGISDRRHNADITVIITVLLLRAEGHEQRPAGSSTGPSRRRS
jgi:hypothetical protein